MLHDEHRSLGSPTISTPPALPTPAEAFAQMRRLELKACPLRRSLQGLPLYSEEVELVRRNARLRWPEDKEGKLVASEPKLVLPNLNLSSSEDTNTVPHVQTWSTAFPNEGIENFEPPPLHQQGSGGNFVPGQNPPRSHHTGNLPLAPPGGTGSPPPGPSPPGGNPRRPPLNGNPPPAPQNNNERDATEVNGLPRASERLSGIQEAQASGETSSSLSYGIPWKRSVIFCFLTSQNGQPTARFTDLPRLDRTVSQLKRGEIVDDHETLAVISDMVSSTETRTNLREEETAAALSKGMEETHVEIDDGGSSSLGQRNSTISASPATKALREVAKKAQLNLGGVLK
ncbi:hypothetical protein JCM3765_000475 [Sporobolomyces pararoseus]